MTVLSTVLAVGAVAGAPALHGQSAKAAPGSSAEASPGTYVVEVSAEDYAFRIPESLPSGWVTLRFANEGEEHHFLFLMKMPEGKTYEDYVVEVGEAFGEVYTPLRAGEIDRERAIELMGELIPDWFWQVRQMGGSGLLAPGETAEVTVKLEAGNYVVECYMKTEEGEFHGLEGMLDPLTVTEEDSGGSPPAADIRVTVTNEGFATDRELTPGRHTVAVHYAEHPEGGLAHNLNLARLDGDTEAERVAHWIQWLNVEGLTPPAPAHFLGGVREMAAGSTGYFTVDLEPGRHLWISETTAGMGMFQEFTVD